MATQDQFFGIASAAEHSLFENALSSALSASTSADAVAPLATGTISQLKHAPSQAKESKTQKKSPIEKEEAGNGDATRLPPCIPLPIQADSPPTFPAGRFVPGEKRVIPSERMTAPESAQAGPPSSVVAAKEEKRASMVVEARQLEGKEGTGPGDSPEAISERNPVVQHATKELGLAAPSRGEPELNPPNVSGAILPAVMDRSISSDPAFSAQPPAVRSSSLQQKLQRTPPDADVSAPRPQIPSLQNSQIPYVADVPGQVPPLTDTPQLSPRPLPHVVTVAPQVAGDSSNSTLIRTPAPHEHSWTGEFRTAKSDSAVTTNDRLSVVPESTAAQWQSRANSLHEMQTEPASEIKTTGQNAYAKIHAAAPASDSHQPPAPSTRPQERNAEPISNQQKSSPPTAFPDAVVGLPAGTSSAPGINGAASPPASTPALPAQPFPTHSQPADIAMNPPLHDLQQATPAALPLQVHAARILQNEDGAEMKLDMHTQTFGAVEVRTIVSGKNVQLAVSAEHGDLSGFLAPEMPVLQNSLQQHNMRLEHVRTLLHVGSQPEFSSGSGRQEQRFSPQRPRVDMFDQPDNEENFDSEDSLRSLSIRI